MSLTTAIAIMALLSTLGMAGFNISKGEHDSEAEEVAERMIEEKMGLPEGTIDLTPTSPEKK